MLVDRKQLTTHLGKISCGGLLKDAILSERFQCTGFSVAQDLLVVTAGMEKADPLASVVGVVGLDLLISVLGIGDDEKITFDIVENHLVLKTGDRTIQLVTADPSVIGSKADQHMVERVLAAIPADSKWVPLPSRLVTGILDAAKKLKAENIFFLPGPAGTKIIVGEEKQNSISFKFPELVAPTEYKLVLPSPVLLAVLGQITDYTKAEITLTGPDSIVPVREGSYLFVVSPGKEV